MQRRSPDSFAAEHLDQRVEPLGVALAEGGRGAVRRDHLGDRRHPIAFDRCVVAEALPTLLRQDDRPADRRRPRQRRPGTSPHRQGPVRSAEGMAEQICILRCMAYQKLFAQFPQGFFIKHLFLTIFHKLPHPFQKYLRMNDMASRFGTVRHCFNNRCRVTYYNEKTNRNVNWKLICFEPAAQLLFMPFCLGERILKTLFFIFHNADQLLKWLIKNQGSEKILAFGNEEILSS